MAYMVPESAPRGTAASERLLFQALKEHLPSDYIVYCTPEINGHRPDYVIVGPDLGLVVLAVNQYTDNELYELSSDQWQVYSGLGQLETVDNPGREARGYARMIAGQLELDQRLIWTEGTAQGRLRFPVGFGVVFTKMKQDQLARHKLRRVIPANHMLARDEFDSDHASFSSDQLIEKILDMLELRPKKTYIMSDDEIRAVRGYLLPEVRLGRVHKEPVNVNDQLLLSLRSVRPMDLQQELLARHLGDKNRLLRGAAGSGRTHILAARAKVLLKEHPDWRVLVLCDTVPLSRVIAGMIGSLLEQADDLFDYIGADGPASKQVGYRQRIHIATFREWLLQELRMEDDDGIPALLQRLDKGQVILPKYDAILIDEGQAFAPAWLQLLSCVLNPETQSLLLMEDKGQPVFKRKTSLVRNLGLDFRGRSKVLAANYRNTAQIVAFAGDFYRTHSVLQGKLKEGTVAGIDLIPHKGTNRSGAEPLIQRFRSFAEEAAWVAENMQWLHREAKMPYSEMAVLYRVKNTYYMSYIDMLRKELDRQQLPYDWITDDGPEGRRPDQQNDSVKLASLDSVKGLEFRTVFIVNVESMPYALEDNEEREAALFYIGATRATDLLFLSYSGDSRFTVYLDEIAVRSKPGAAKADREIG